MGTHKIHNLRQKKTNKEKKKTKQNTHKQKLMHLFIVRFTRGKKSQKKQKWD